MDGGNSTDKGYIYFDAFEGEEAIFGTQLFMINMTQHVPYCFEFYFSRMNPLNLTNEDFGKIEIYSWETRVDRNQGRGGVMLGKRPLELKDTILPNSTYPADNSWLPYQLRIDNRKSNWMQIFVKVNRGSQDRVRCSRGFRIMVMIWNSDSAWKIDIPIHSSKKKYSNQSYIKIIIQFQLRDCSAFIFSTKCLLVQGLFIGVNTNVIFNGLTQQYQTF